MSILNTLCMIAGKMPTDDVTHLAIDTASSAPVDIQLSHNTVQSSYFIARILMEFCHWIMRLVGQPHNATLFLWLYVIVVFLFSMVVGLLIKWLVVWIMRKVQPHVKWALYGQLVNHRFFTQICRIIPPLLFLILIQFTLYMHNSLQSWLSRLSFIYIVIAFSIAMCTLSDVIWSMIDQRENKRKLPLRGIVQVVKLIIWIVAVVIIAALLLDKSPGALLAGLGAFAAVLMLVFKDTILGVVAGVQLAQNDSLHEGDWISIPSGNANGIVASVTLTEVKIINWDKTVSTVPPYNLITGGFKNYRNMQQSNTREINRTYLIDADSVVPTTPEMIEEFAKIPLMKDWIEKKLQQRQEGKEHDVLNPDGLADGNLDSNLGIFRAYIRLWLESNPDISHDDDLIVATQQQTSHGLPLWIYCFSSTSNWNAYEGVMSSVFEHVAIMLHRFMLYTFEYPTGRDTMIDGFMSPGKSSAPLFGIPYPFYLGSGTPMQPGIPPTGYETPKFASASQPSTPCVPPQPNAQTPASQKDNPASASQDSAPATAS